MTVSEQATLNFYRWEYRYRGYYHFDTPVDIEIPYLPFRHATCSHTPTIDDGRVPSLFRQVTKLLSPPKEHEESAEETLEIQPSFLAFDSKPNLVGISISFQKSTEIQPNRNIEFLNMLSLTEHLISFEIVGTSESITIQVVCSEHDYGRIESHLQAYFPTAIICITEIADFGFNSENDIAVADFGLNDEYMRSIATTDSFAIDPLTSVIAIMESLGQNDVVVFQILFKGITSPLAKDIAYSVSDGAGGSFFADAPDMLFCANEKISKPLFSVVMRIAAQGESNIRSQYLAQELARSISSISSSEYNKLIPLSNEGYDYDFHKYNLHHRLSNRLGFVLNSKELNTFLHYPNKTVVSQKLGLQDGKTKQVPKTITNQKYLLGLNQHNGLETKVTLNDEMRLRHKHIIGATGVGKSTLIANMIIEDIKQGNGCALFDPHGDIVEDILLRIPEERKEDVIIIDPSDSEFPIGFNLLDAKTDAEKIVLSSDLVSAFKQHATAWGDNMTAVLSNAINAFLESSREGIIIELKRFLLEESFRNEFLMSVDDSSIHYYWEHEYPMVKKGIAPLLTRIDTFLRPKTIRYMLAQTKGLDFRACIEEKKIVLIKLSQGLIGEDNSYLLGSLFLSKFNQVAQGRQVLSKSERHPYYIYLDEFQNFVTPSITSILSGARKYGLGLVLAHQELAQIEDTKVLNSVISNPYTRICFRLGDMDAKRLESGFSYFEQSDLQSLGIGQAIIRVGSANNDFNISTYPLSNIKLKEASIIKNYIISNTRKKYSLSRAEVEQILNSLLPKSFIKKDSSASENENIKTIEKAVVEPTTKVDLINEPNSETQTKTSFEKQKEQFLESHNKRERSKKHYELQNFVKTAALELGYKVTLEEKIENDNRVDVSLLKDKIKIAVEISVTNSIEYEVQNIKKCIQENFDAVFMLCDNKTHLENIKSKALSNLTKKQLSKTYFVSSESFFQQLNKITPKNEIVENRIKGYRVKTNYNSESLPDKKQKSISEIILQSLRRKK